MKPQIRGTVPCFTEVGASAPRATPRSIPQARSTGGPSQTVAPGDTGAVGPARRHRRAAR